MKKIILLLACLAMLNSMTGYCQLTQGLVGYWKLDGSAADAIGVNNGSLVGPPASTTGKIGTAYSFNPGQNYYVSIPNSTSLNIQTNTITLSAWIYPNSGGVQMIVSKIANVGTHNYPYFQYNLQLNQESNLYPRFFLSIGGTAYYAANNTVSMNYDQWYFVTGTYDGTTMRLYLNGSQVATTAVSGNILAYSTPVYIGKNGALGESFIGTIDEVGIWNRTLSASEVSQLYNSGNGLTYSFGTYSLSTTVSPTAGGSITLSPSGGSYSSGTTVTATAVANSGYTFSGWSGALTGSTNPGTITMNANKTVSATFNIVNNQPPVATNVNLSGSTAVGQILTGSYSYSDAEGNPQGSSIIKWYRADNISGANQVQISGATSSTYTLTSSDLNKYIKYEVTPVATSGTSPGSPGQSPYYGPVTQTVSTTWLNNGSNIFYNSGNVGIGISSPTHMLQVNNNSTNGVFVIKSGGISNDFTVSGVSYPRQFGLGVMTGQSYASDIPATQPGWFNGYGGYIGGWFDVNSGPETNTNLSGVVTVLRGSGSGKAFGFYSNLTNVTNYTKYGIYSTGESLNYFSGKVGIGTASPTTELTVNGKILAKEVEVVATIASDYVFEPEYELMPLTDLEIYLKKNKHLPGIPSAIEFKNKGQNLGEMQDLLLRKIEELTLYIISQEKVIKELREEIDSLKAKEE